MTLPLGRVSRKGAACSGDRRSYAPGMARTWLKIRVELLGRGGIECDLPPGRDFIVGPGHSFAQLAAAIDDAFARWDRSHLRACRWAAHRLPGRRLRARRRLARPRAAQRRPRGQAGRRVRVRVRLRRPLAAPLPCRRAQARPSRRIRADPAATRGHVGLGLDPGPVRTPAGLIVDTDVLVPSPAVRHGVTRCRIASRAGKRRSRTPSATSG
jgi:hypothetical protein